MNKKIIIINGKGASGKDTFVNYVGNYIKTENYSSVDLIKKIAKHLGYNGGKSNKDRKFLSDLKMLSSNYNDLPYIDVVEKILEFLYTRDNTNQLLFIHVREPEEIQRLIDFATKSNIDISTLLIKRNGKNFNSENITYGNFADDNAENYDYDNIIENNKDLEHLQNLAKSYINNTLKLNILI